MGETTSQANAARLYALLVGGLLVLAGIAGFAVESSFATGADLSADEAAGTFAVNGWSNVLYLLSGAVGLALGSRAPRRFALGAGGLYLVLAVWGWLAVEEGFGTLLEVIPLNGADNWLHLLIGAAGIAAGLTAATPRVTQGRRARRPAAGGSG